MSIFYYNRTMVLKNKQSFTLMEILITITLIALVGATVPMTLNFKKQVDRSNDTKRKSELNMMRSLFEEYYNDKKSYPRPDEICYDYASIGSTRYIDSLGINTSCVCHICGSKITTLSSDNKTLINYLKEIPCDPNSTAVTTDNSRDYIYNYDCDNGSANPQWYKIYAKLKATDDPAINDVGCALGCGPKFIKQSDSSKIQNTDVSLISNNYVVYSSNTQPEKTANTCSDYTRFWKKDTTNLEGCNIHSGELVPNEIYYTAVSDDPATRGQCLNPCIAE